MDEDPSHSDRRWFLPVLLVATASLKLALAYKYPGFLSGDDFETVATAARCAAGLDYRPWPIRSLVHPLILACPPAKGARLAGLGGPRELTLAASIPTIAFSTLAIWILYRLAVSLGWSRPAARVAAVLFAFHWLPLAYGATPFPRPVSGCLLLAAFWLVARQKAASAPGLFAAGLLAGAAFAVRWSEGVMLLPLLAYSVWRRRRVRPLAMILCGFLVSVGLLVGLFDAITWGRPFASLLAFARFLREPNLGGFRSGLWYGSMALQWAGPILLLLAAAALRDRRAVPPLSIALSFAVLLSFSPLKEMRYLQICIPFLALAAGLGWERLRAGAIASRTIAAAALALCLPLGLERTLHLLRHKSQSAIEAAALLARVEPAARVVVLEQAWAYGEKLYLGNAVTIRDLAPQRPLSAGLVRSAAEGAAAVCLYRSDVSKDIGRELARLDLRDCGTIRRDASPAVAVYLTANRPCPKP